MTEVTAGILFIDQKVLIARRPEGKHLAGFWEFPGGKAEPGETYEDSLVREFSEEFGVDILVDRKFHENVHVYPDKTIKLVSYLVRHAGGDFVLREHEEIRWVSLQDLLTYPLSPADVPVAVKLVSGRPGLSITVHDNLK